MFLLNHQAQIRGGFLWDDEEIFMNKYLNLLLFSLMVFVGCEELKGPMGPAGADGTANMHVEVIQLTPRRI